MSCEKCNKEAIAHAKDLFMDRAYKGSGMSRQFIEGKWNSLPLNGKLEWVKVYVKEQLNRRK